MQQWICHIKGLESVFGAREVERLGRQIDGVHDLVVDFAGETIVLWADSRDVLKRLENRLGRLGYKVLNKGYSVRSEVRVENLNDASAQAYIRKKIGAHTFVSNLDIRPLSELVILTHSSDYSIADFVCDLNNHGIKAQLRRQQLGKSFWHKFSYIFVVLSTFAFLIGTSFDFIMHNQVIAYSSYLASIIFSVPMLLLKAGRQFVLEKKLSHDLMLVFLIGFTLYFEQWFVVAFIGISQLILQQRESGLGLSLRKKWTKIRSNEIGVAFIKSGSGRTAVSASELTAGDVVNVMAGEILPADGVIVSGQGQFDEKYLTGSDKIVSLEKNSIVYAGMKLLAGEVDVRLSVESVKNKSTLLYRQLESMQTKITQLQSKIKTSVEYLLYVTMFVSVSVIVSILVFDVDLPESLLDKSLSMMLVSSAAFIIVTIQYSNIFSSLIAAENGLYFFQPDYWKKLSCVDTVILDKNGVVTCNKPEVCEVISLSTYAIKDVLRIASSLSGATDDERFLPIRDRAVRDNIALDKIDALDVVKGKSISGNINGQYFCIGSQSVFEKAELITPAIYQKLRRWEEEGANIMLVADDVRIFGLVTIIDPVRDETSGFVDCAHEKLGLKVVMLSHDNAGTSQVLAHRYGFDDVVSEITDDGKVEAIDSYTSKHSVLLISNRHDLVLNGENQISLVNEALGGQYFEGSKAVVSLGVRLMSSLNLVAMARKIDARIKRVLFVVGAAKLIIIAGILSGYFSLGTVVGFEFLLGYWVLFSTYRPKNKLVWAKENA